MRKSIFDIIEEQYDFNKEFKKISHLFNCNMVHRGGYGYPIEWLVNTVFHNWKARGSSINCADMCRELDIDKISKKQDLSFDEIALCLEYYLNIFLVFTNKCFPLPEGFSLNNDTFMLHQNMDILIEHMNLKKHVLTDKEKVLLLPNNPAATAVAEISPKDIAFSILRYNHASLKGQVEEKRKLLWLDREPALYNSNYIGMFDLTKGIFMIEIILLHCINDYFTVMIYDDSINIVLQLLLSPLTILRYGSVPMLFMICGYGIRRQSMKKSVKNQIKLFNGMIMVQSSFLKMEKLSIFEKIFMKWER